LLHAKGQDSKSDPDPLSKSLENALAITEQEANIEPAQKELVTVPDLVKRLIEQWPLKPGK
jgi:hypothetical protein